MRLKKCKKQMNREAGEDVEDGGVDLPQNTDGSHKISITRCNIIGADDVE